MLRILFSFMLKSVLVYLASSHEKMQEYLIEGKAMLRYEKIFKKIRKLNLSAVAD